MPNYLVHVGAEVLCAHTPGTATPESTNSRVSVSGKETVLVTSLYSVENCSNPLPTASVGPCVKGTWLVGTTRVTSNGMPLVVTEGISFCVPTFTPLKVQTAQKRVTAT